MNDRPRTSRFRVRFSLAAALLGLIGSAFAMAWIGRPWLEARRLEQQREAEAAEEAAIRALGANMVFRWEGRIFSICFEGMDVFDHMLPEILRHAELDTFQTNPIGKVDGFHIAVPRVGLTDAGIVRLAKLSKLRFLAVHGEGITDACLPALARMPNLGYLQLVNTSVSDAALKHHFAGKEVVFRAWQDFEPSYSR